MTRLATQPRINFSVSGNEDYQVSIFAIISMMERPRLVATLVGVSHHTAAIILDSTTVSLEHIQDSLGLSMASIKDVSYLAVAWYSTV